ncbi:hypothetical protein NPIL_538141 [Nephila pilipes]|uniref:Uncharacterized protein n=1 Tax=Nephila pilipes TaxID=299642 RepID=A0A8X6P5Z1_NEPPI|nr:hypothetical protein NPIL_538141 [Nephila pilipes]
MLFFVTLFADMRSDDDMMSPSSHAPLRKEKLVIINVVVQKTEWCNVFTCRNALRQHPQIEPGTLQARVNFLLHFNCFASPTLAEKKVKNSKRSVITTHSYIDSESLKSTPLSGGESRSKVGEKQGIPLQVSVLSDTSKHRSGSEDKEILLRMYLPHPPSLHLPQCSSLLPHRPWRKESRRHTHSPAPIAAEKVADALANAAPPVITEEYYPLHKDAIREMIRMRVAYAV